MGEAHVARRFDASADTLWSILSWRGMTQLVGDGLFAGVTFESGEDGVGAIKLLDLGQDPPVRERLEWLDEPGHGYGYRLLDSGPLGVAEYSGSVRITACGPDACTVLIRCAFVPLDLSDADWAAQWRANESAMLEGLAARLAAGTLPVAPAQDDIATIIRARSDLFEADFASGDAARLVANYYVATPRVIMPDSPLLEGREAITAMFAGLMQDHRACTLRQVDVRQSGDMAYELSEATVIPRDPAGDPLAVRYIIIWIREGGEWRVSVDFFAWDHLGLAPTAAS